jgi:hypothetical protein
MIAVTRPRIWTESTTVTSARQASFPEKNSDFPEILGTFGAESPSGRGIRNFAGVADRLDKLRCGARRRVGSRPARHPKVWFCSGSRGGTGWTGERALSVSRLSAPCPAATPGADHQRGWTSLQRRSNASLSREQLRCDATRSVRGWYRPVCRYQHGIARGGSEWRRRMGRPARRTAAQTLRQEGHRASSTRPPGSAAADDDDDASSGHPVGGTAARGAAHRWPYPTHPWRKARRRPRSLPSRDPPPD